MGCKTIIKRGSAIGIVLVVAFSLLLSAVLVMGAPLVSHPLSEILPIDVDLDMYKYKLNNVSAVGVGTTNPQQELTVVGDANFTFGIDSPEAFLVQDADGYPWFKIDADNGWTTFENAKVGIGTSTPAKMLDIHGDMQIDLSGSGGTFNILQPGGTSGSAQIVASSPDGGTGFIILSDNSSRANIAKKDTGMGFATHGPASNPSSSQLWLDNNGYVGIGSTSPTAALHVTTVASDDTPNVQGTQISGDGSIELTSNGKTPHIDFQNDISGTDYDASISLIGDDALTIDGAGLGIGQAPGTYQLYVNGESYFANDIFGTEGFNMDDDATNVFDDVTSDSPYSRVNADSFHTNGLGQGQMFIEGDAMDANGPIKIGQGNAGGQSQQDIVLGDNNELYVDTSANAVGIGDSTPSYTFDVAGTIRSTSSTYVNDDLGVTDYAYAFGGVHVGGSSDPGTDNLIVDGTAYTGNYLRVNGASNTDAALSVYGENTVAGTVRFIPNSGKTGSQESHIHYGTYGDWYIRSASNTLGSVRIQDGGGYTYIGSAGSNLDYLYVYGLTGTTSGSYLRWYNNRVYYYSSSNKTKRNITDYKTDWYDIFKLQPKTFIDKQTNESHIGYIAEDLVKQGLDPLVTYLNSTDIAGIDYQIIPVYTVEVLKDMDIRLKAQKDKIDSQAEELDMLKSELCEKDSSYSWC